MEERNNIELKSPEMQEIMTKPPAWLSRWGIVVILGLLAIALVFSVYIRYPDLIKAPFRFVAIPSHSYSEISFQALVHVPADGPLSVNPGQEVILKVNQYPYLEYGVLSGRVDQLSFLPETNEFQVIISLPGSLVTNSGIKINPMNGSRGMAEIKVNDMSLFQRLMLSMKSANNKN